MKKHLSLLLTLTLTMTAALAGCSGSNTGSGSQAPAAAESTPAASQKTRSAEGAGGGVPASTATGETSGTSTDTQASDADRDAGSPEETGPIIRVGSLKGPTSMGLVHLMDLNEKGEAGNRYEFTMVAAADELVAKIASKDLDIALVPANVSSVLFNKTKGAVSVIDINTLGVLDIVASDDSIQSIGDLKDRTVYLTGKGTTPDYVLHYLMEANGLTEDDVKLEYKSEATEVAAVLKEQPDAIGLLPQPFVTAACMQNENLKIVLDLTVEWDNANQKNGSESRLVTGVTIVRNEFLEEHPEAVSVFLEEHLTSADFAEAHASEASVLVADLGIIEKAPIAEKAIPYCNLVCITGDYMRTCLEGYLQVLYDQNPASVGGAMPTDEFYYIP